MIRERLPPLSDYSLSVLHDIVHAVYAYAAGPADQQTCFYLQSLGFIRRIRIPDEVIRYVATEAGRFEAAKPRR